MHFLFAICFAIEGYAQFSKTHYIPPITAHDTHKTSLPKEQFLYISTPSTTPFNVKITPVGGVSESFTISNSTPIEYVIREKLAGETNLSPMFSQFITPSSTTESKFNNLGFIVEADNQVYVSVRLLAGTKYEQGGALVSKGLAGLGNTFRVGALPSLIRADHQNSFIGGTKNDFLSFVSVLAVEDNTQVDFSDFSPSVTILNGTPKNVNLDSGESYIIVLQTDVSTENFDGLVGVLVQSTKPIAVNCGSFNGTSHDAQSSRDVGIDQIVPIERIGKEYIFVRARGGNTFEKPIIVAHQNNTDIFIDGGAAPIATINAGEYHVIDGLNYGADGNMYVNTSNNVYAYQGIGGTTNPSNQGMFFVPPLNCRTPKIVNNIPFVNKVGDLGVITIYNEDGSVNETKDVSAFDGGLAVITEAGSSMSVNGVDIMTFGAVKQTVVGNTNYETYYIESLPNSTSNISIVSTGELYVASFGANDKAAFGGFYSGFEFKPEIILTDTSLSKLGTCIPNVELSLNDISYYDSYQWYLDGVAIPGANSINYIPTTPGYYYVEGQIIGCPPAVTSEIIPVSLCPPDVDNDEVNDNIDVDNDNDGILNCTESFGSEPLELSNPLVGSVNSGSISFTGTIVPPAASTYITGFSDGHFNSNVPVNENLEYQLNFSNQVNILFEYATTGSISFSNDESFTVRVPSTNTITLIDPDDQLLVDTDFDGIYETGVTQFSSFDIRFKIKNNALAIGAGTFGFYSHATNAFTFKHHNETLSATDSNVPFKMTATCIAMDTDKDGVENALDLDSDNDGIPDIIEASSQNIVISNVDTNQDGLDDVFNGDTPNNADSDGIPDYIDVDSDNDGIFDLEESGSALPDSDKDGIIDNALATIGVNGWVDTAETTPNSGVIGYSVLDTDSDTMFNYIDDDSDGDACSDVTEAGFTDNGSGEIVGTGTDVNGVVVGSDGYTTPNQDYLIFKIINITTEPANQEVCELLGAVSFNIVTDAEFFQWQFFDGSNWIDIIDDTVYSGSTSTTLAFTNVTLTLDGSRYRVQLNSTGNACALVSQEVKLTVNQTLAPTGSALQEFCSNSTASIADLIVVGSNIQWYSDIVSTSPLSNTTLLSNGSSYYASQTISGCESTNRLEVVVRQYDTPDINNPGPQVTCDSFSLPVITGTFLSGSESYYNDSQLNGGVQITGAITSSQTVWIYDVAGACSDEEYFEVTINTAPIADTPSDLIACDGYVLPALTGGNYYTGSGGTGTLLNAGDVITTTQTIYVYAESGTIPNCFDENSFTITIEPSPNVDTPSDVSACESYRLPVLTEGNYFTESLGAGMALFSGDVINTTQTVYVFAEVTSCFVENSFMITINTAPIVDAPMDEIHCDSYSLPILINGNYYTGSGGAGTMLSAGDVITTTQTIYVYAESGTIPNCIDENSFTVTIEQSPITDAPGDVSVCESYVLPDLTEGDYFTGTLGTGIALFSGDIINTTQTVYIYAKNTNCEDENNFLITISDPIEIDNPGSVTECDSYTLPTITGVNLSGSEAYYNDSQINGGTQITVPITTTQTVWIYDSFGECFAEESFQISINPLPVFSIEDGQICSSDPVSTTTLEPILANPSGVYSYVWTAPDGSQLFTKDITVSLEGSYFLEVTKTDGTGCSLIQSIEVKSSEQAIIDEKNIQIIEFSSNNSISIINPAELGKGDYEFALEFEGVTGPYQKEASFDHLIPGIYILHIVDNDGCDSTQSEEIFVGGFPKFFTPNNDFVNDTWNPLGIEDEVLVGADLYIFDRFGKLIIKLDPLGDGWDGRFKGVVLPPTDYWYQIILQDGRVFKGHFSLIR